MSDVETMALSLPSKTTMRGRWVAASSGVRAQNVKTMTRSPSGGRAFLPKADKVLAARRLSW